VQLVVERTARQKQAWTALDDPTVRRVLYGGAKGGGKSYLLCVWAFTYAWQVMSDHKLKPSSNPPHIGWIGRKQATDFTATTLQTWRQTIPEEYYELRSGTERDSRHILIMGRIAIDYGGLDRQESINKFNSAEYAFFCIDQAEEVERDDIAVLRGSLRKTLGGKPLAYKELYTANPRACWLRDDFITDKLPGGVFVPALPSDNPYLPAEYERTLVDAFGYRPELLAAYLHGDWSMIEDPSQVVLDRWLVLAMQSDGVYKGRIISCDVARFGDDHTVIMVMEGSGILQEESYAQSRTTEVSARLVELSRANHNCPIVVDVVGVGGGVVDELYQRGRYVIPFNSAEKAANEGKYYNKRAEAWWECAEGLAKADIGCRRMSAELRKELCVPRYELRNGRILIESKESIKERAGYSPDVADCYVMGIWGVRNMDVQPTYAEIGRPDLAVGADPYRNWDLYRTTVRA
jgi:phage terminase large subunit